MDQLAQSKSKKQMSLDDNKKVSIESINSIQIKKFRSFADRTVELGSQVTVLIGRNGTMKTSLMGLIAHPFSSDSKDVFGKELKTKLKEVFRLSEKYDSGQYSYSLIMKPVDSNELLKEEVKIYYVAENTNRHRVVVSGSEKGDGNFSFNTSFLNLKRLLPLVDTGAKPDSALQLNNVEMSQQKDFYEKVLPSSEYDKFIPIHEKGLKTTFAPEGEKATYDYKSISSGEDNLGAIFNRLIGFQRSFQRNQKHGNGILCIDEFESSLHPIAQLNLFKYLYSWAAKYKVQIVITTHSLHLIQFLYLKQSVNLDAKRIVVNLVSCATAKSDKNYPILQNPKYQLAYQELTLEKVDDVIESQKINIFCEDDLAVHFIKRLIKNKSLLKRFSFHCNLDQSASNSGTSYTSLAKLCQNFSLLLQNSIVIFDADIKDTDIAKIKNRETFIKLPDSDGFAIERRIVYFIVSLKNEDPFFVKFKNERTWFLNEFKDCGIESLTASDIANPNIIDITQCKNWANSNLSEFKKYVTYYCGQLENNNDFLQQVMDRVNVINEKRGLPQIF